MPYDWSKVLSQEEILKKEFTVSQRFILAIIFLTTLAAIAVFIFSFFAGIFILLLGILYFFYWKRAKHYACTSRRLVLVDSFFGVNIISIDYSQITDIETEQSFIDQLCGWGTLVINTAGTHTPAVRLSFIDNPQSIKQAIDAIRDKK